MKKQCKKLLKYLDFSEKGRYFAPASVKKNESKRVLRKVFFKIFSKIFGSLKNTSYLCTRLDKGKSPARRLKQVLKNFLKILPKDLVVKKTCLTFAPLSASKMRFVKMRVLRRLE